MSTKIAATAAGLLVLALYTVGSGYWVQTSGSWYASLQRPSWQPPDWAFGIAWPYNFTVLGFAAFILPRRLNASITWWWVALFAASVVAALIWSQQFYGPHRLTVAAIALGVAAAFTSGLVVMAWRGSIGIGLALIPYQLWLLVATSLSIGYALKN